METEEKILLKNVVTEMESSFLDYSMSVIVSRALPDVRDGLKPVHRRIIYTMWEEGLSPEKAFRKSATTVGSVLGRYHPHGDVAVYESLVRMAQDFSSRHLLVEGHGNFGSIDGYPAAAMRYTEARLSRLSLELLKDINKNTVNFIDNYDGTRKEPQVLPSRYPNVLVNGGMGIAVGMATNIPPHNLSEVIDGCIAFIDNNDITTLELMEHIKGPDFPTGANILGNSGIKQAYDTGKGSITIRSKTEITEKKGVSKIIITEIPYQVNKGTLIAKIGELVRNKIIEGISDLHDQSTIKQGIKIVLDLKREANANVVLNNLYKHTQLQVSYGINMLMLVDGQPKILGLKTILDEYIKYQKLVIKRRVSFDLDRAEKSAHIYEGLKIALDNIDEVIKLIRNAKSDQEAFQALQNKFALSDLQIQAILEMKLRRLTGLEKEKIEQELKKLGILIKELKEILASEQMIIDIIKKEMLEIKDKHGDERRTKIDDTAIEFIEDESLIPIKDSVILLTKEGYIKRMTSDNYKIQNKGGVGIKGMSTNDEDLVEHLINASTHDYIMFISNKGKIYRIKGYEIGEYTRQSKGLPIINLLPIEKDEQINSILISKQDCKNLYLILTTKYGIVKRTDLKEFDSIRVSGKIAISLKENDEVIAAHLTDGTRDVVLGSSNGRMARFNETEVRVMGRTASGVRGINLIDNEICIGAEIASEGHEILVLSEKGYGKRTNIEEYRVTRRGSKGVKTLNITKKTGQLITFKALENLDNDLMIITTNGTIIRLELSSVSKMSRVTQGVKLITLKDNQYVASASIVSKEEEEVVPRETSEENI